MSNVTYYKINEDAARRAKEMNSFYDYKPGSATEEYKAMVDKAVQARPIRSEDGRAHRRRPGLFPVRRQPGLPRRLPLSRRLDAGARPLNVQSGREECPPGHLPAFADTGAYFIRLLS